MRHRRRALLGAALIASLFVSTPARAQQVTESFSGSLSLGNGTVFGRCNQLVSRTGGGGSISVSGGLATISTPVNAAGALIASAAPLPGAFVLRAEVRGLQVGAVTNNFMNMLSVTNKAPAVATGAYYNNATTAEVVAYPLFGIVVAVYDNSGALQAWNGTAWVTSYVPAIATFSASSRWAIGIDRTNGGIKFTIRRDGTTVVDTTRLPNAQVRGGPYYLITGEAATDFGAASMQVDSLTMPEPPTCPPPPDASVDSTVDSGPSPDTTRDQTVIRPDTTQPTPDSTPPPADGPVTPPGDGPVTPPGDGPVTPPTDGTPPVSDLPQQPLDGGGGGGRFDVAFNPNPPADGGSEGCALPGAGETTSSTLLVLLALLALAALRRRRR